MCIDLNSPVHDQALAAQVRAVWTSENPAQHLFDSLLLDYAIGEQKSDATFQGDAAMRLVYYFPRETAQMFADRLRQLGAHAPPELTKAISWCQEPVLRAALLDIFRRTTAPPLLVSLLPAIVPEHTQQALARLDALLHELPETEGPYGDGYHVLVSLGRYVGEPAKPVFKRYLHTASTQRCMTMCRVLHEVCRGWDIQLLTPLLADRRLDYSESHPIDPSGNGPHLVSRVCDMAAETISANHPDLLFRMSGRYTALDQQIATMRERISKRQR
jgi:hypothetical protein